MSYELLQRAANASLPLTLANPADINMLRAYVAARLVHAEIPQPVRTGHLFLQPAATLHEITPVGYQALETSQTAAPPVRAAPAPKAPAPPPGLRWLSAAQPV